MDTQQSAVLSGFISEEALAAELGRTTRTLARWRSLRVGPPHVRNGREVRYSIEAARQWLAAGGTNGTAHKRSKRR